MAAARRASASRAASVAFHQDNFGTGELKPTRLLNQDPPWPTRRHEDRHARLRRPRRLHRPALGEDAAAQDRPWHGGENLLGDLCEWIAQPVLEGTASSSGLNFEEGGGADEEDDLGEDKARFGEHRANAALADEEKDKKRIIHDATHGVKVNNRIKCRDKLEEADPPRAGEGEGDRLLGRGRHFQGPPPLQASGEHGYTRAARSTSRRRCPATRIARSSTSTR